MFESKLTSKNCKIVFAGDDFVGKTTICKRLTNTLVSSKDIQITCGIDLHHMKIANGRVIYATLYDLGGQERFRIMQKSFFVNADIVALVFSLDCYPSYLNLRNWLLLIKDSYPHKTYLIANKADIKGKVINKEESQKFANEHDMTYFEISALKGINFENFRNQLIQSIIGLFKKEDFIKKINIPL